MNNGSLSIEGRIIFHYLDGRQYRAEVEVMAIIAPADIKCQHTGKTTRQLMASIGVEIPSNASGNEVREIINSLCDEDHPLSEQDYVVMIGKIHSSDKGYYDVQKQRYVKHDQSEVMDRVLAENFREKFLSIGVIQSEESLGIFFEKLLSF